MMVSETFEVGKAKTIAELVRTLEEFTRQAAETGVTLHQVGWCMIRAKRLWSTANGRHSRHDQHDAKEQTLW